MHFSICPNQLNWQHLLNFFHLHVSEWHLAEMTESKTITDFPLPQKIKKKIILDKTAVVAKCPSLYTYIWIHHCPPSWYASPFAPQALLTPFSMHCMLYQLATRMQLLHWLPPFGLKFPRQTRSSYLQFPFLSLLRCSPPFEKSEHYSQLRTLPELLW